MDCAHDTGSDGSVVVKSLSHRSEAVSGAGCSGNDGVILSKSLVVYIVNDSGEVIACGSRDNNLLSTGVDVSLGLSLGYIETCALENNVNTELTPRKISSVGLSVDGDLLAVNDDSTGSYNGLAIFSIYSGLNINSVKVLADSAAVAALSGIILEKVSEHLRLGKVVDSYYLIALCTEHLTECETADTAETVDCNFY